MWIDVGMLLILAFYTLLGYFQGIIVQVFRLIGLVLVFFYIRFVAEPVGQWLAAHLDMNAIGAYYIALIAGALIVYAACAVLGKAIHKMVAQTEKPQTLDRVLGCALGFIKGAIVAFLIVCMFDMIPPSRLSGWPWMYKQVTGSGLIVRAHSYNPLPELRFLADADDYKKLLDDPDAQRIFQTQPAFVALQNHPKFRLLVSDPEVRDLVARKQWADVLVHEKLLALVFDRDVRKILNQLNPKAALEEAAKMRGGK